MPTYEYRCNECGHDFELFQQMSDAVKRKCPKCGKLKLERLIGTGAGIIFKGSGFYQTDYRSDSYKKAAEAEKKPTSDKKKSENKTETGSSSSKKATSSSDSSSASKAKPSSQE